MKRYKQVIYFNVTKRCKEWNIARLDLQFSEVVNDVVGSVINILCEEDFRTLKKFRNRENEKQFRWYLVTICHHASGRYMKKYLQRYIAVDPADLNAEGEMANDTLGQIYESVVETIRSSTRKGSANLERDINLFLLTVWSGFDKDMILKMPVYKGSVTPKMIDNAVFRMREVLRQTGLQ